MKLEIIGGADAKAGWSADKFEDHIAASIIGLYENISGLPDTDWPSATNEDLAKIRKRGVFIQHPNRPVFSGELDSPLDNVYDGLFCESIPGSIAANALSRIAKHGFDIKEGKTVYATFHVIKRALKIPRPFYAVKAGTPYCFIGMTAKDGKLVSDAHYFTAKGTQIYPCAVDIEKKKQWNYQHRPPVLEGLSLAENLVNRVTMTANTLFDRQFQWQIMAHESSVTVGLQCYHDEVKSLLYARSLPITSTGRKRPILHLVAAHKRRLKEGIEIDISEFLRGIRKVEMAGSIFEVCEPKNRPKR